MRAEDLRKLADFMEANGLEEVKHFSLAVGSTGVSLNLWETRYDTEEEITTARKLRRTFGPMEVRGTEPSQRLCGYQELDGGIKVDCTIYGSYDCTITGHKEMDLTQQEVQENERRALSLAKQADDLLSKRTKTEAQYTCVPIAKLRNKDKEQVS